MRQTIELFAVMAILCAVVVLTTLAILAAPVRAEESSATRWPTDTAARDDRNSSGASIEAAGVASYSGQTQPAALTHPRRGTPSADGYPQRPANASL